MKTSNYIQKICAAGIVLFMMCFLTTGNAQNERLDYATSVEDLETAKATVKAYEAQNWKELRTYLSDDAKIYGLASFDSLNAEETITYWTRGSEQAAPELKEKSWLAVAVPDGPRKGNWVYHWGVNTLSYTSGQKISFPYHIALKIKDSKVSEAHFYYDNMKIIREMGYAISPPLEDGEAIEEVLDLNFKTGAEKK